MARASAAALLLASVAILWRLAARGGSGQSGACGAAFLRSGGGPARPPAEAAPWPVRSLSRETAGLALALAACGAAYGLHHGWRAKTPVSLRRPYVIPDLHRTLGADLPRDPSAELSRIFGFIQDVVLRPLDERLPGRPFEYDFHSFPFTPMVLVIGNHSSGKSTFINRMFGKDLQETGVAPTDDGFTILERHARDQQEDGPTVMGCPENRPYAELRRFGQIFSGHLKRKRIVLPEGSGVPFGLQIVDTPGMIDLPANTGTPGANTRGRGYNFVDVVRWWAKRSDLILLLFDPDKPGTTGETLEVLTKSLEGLNHKFLIVLNKVDKLDNSVDFARAYGSLGWALSKVIKWKDIPQVYTVYNEGFENAARAARSMLPMEVFSKKREELLDEVMRVRERHNDNIITALEETLRQVEMVCTVIETIRSRACRRKVLLQAGAVVGMGVPVLVAVWLLISGAVVCPDAWACFGVTFIYIMLCFGCAACLREFYGQYHMLLTTSVDAVFRERYSQFFIHDDGEDFQYRWQVVSPKVQNILESVQSLSYLPRFRKWEMTRISDCLHNDVWYLRQLARKLREPDPPTSEGINSRVQPDSSTRKTQ